MNENEKLYIQAEDIGRGLFTEFLNQNGITEITYEVLSSPVDIKFKDKENKKYVVEIKVRKEDKLNYDLHMLEPKKYRALLWDGDTPMYVNFFGTNIMYIYNENAIRKHTRETSMRAVSTVEDKGYKQSECYFVDSKLAKKYKLDENGKWINYK